MDLKMIGTIIILVLAVTLMIMIFVAVYKATKKVREFSRLAFGTENIAEGIKKTELEYANTPKTVSGATKMYLPQIMRDFPEFHLQEMKERAENVLLSYLRCIHEENSSHLTEGTEELREELDTKIAMLQKDHCREHFESVKIHRTEIMRYNREKGRVSIVFQSAVGSINYVERDGKVIRGKKDRFTQSRYNVEVSYIQDREYIAETGTDGHSLSCPNCGAPIAQLGAERTCRYCGTVVNEAFNIKVWMFTGVKLVN